jgi:hypothetical protein
MARSTVIGRISAGRKFLDATLTVTCSLFCQAHPKLFQPRSQFLADRTTVGVPLTVRNLDAWYPAFDVKPGEKLYLTPDQRVRIW